jgi:hypothetical protein
MPPRDPDNPDLSWEDQKKLLADNPGRPFYVSGKTDKEQAAKAQERCDEDDRKAKAHSDVTGGTYWTCEEDETDD